MLNQRKLKAIIVERGTSQKGVAKVLNITDKTFYTKMKTGKFTLPEMSKMIKYLQIDDPSSIFFAGF